MSCRVNDIEEEVSRVWTWIENHEKVKSKHESIFLCMGVVLMLNLVLTVCALW